MGRWGINRGGRVGGGGGLGIFNDHLYSAILRSLEQTHCACMWFYMSD